MSAAVASVGSRQAAQLGDIRVRAHRFRAAAVFLIPLTERVRRILGCRLGARWEPDRLRASLHAFGGTLLLFEQPALLGTSAAGGADACAPAGACLFFVVCHKVSFTGPPPRNRCRRFRARARRVPYRPGRRSSFERRFRAVVLHQFERDTAAAGPAGENCWSRSIASPSTALKSNRTRSGSADDRQPGRAAARRKRSRACRRLPPPRGLSQAAASQASGSARASETLRERPAPRSLRCGPASVRIAQRAPRRERIGRD